MKETEKVPFDSMPPLIRGSFLTKEQAEKLKEPFKDVVSVVRCKDCKMGEKDTDYFGKPCIICTNPQNGVSNAWHKPDWFCSDGEIE